MSNTREFVWFSVDPALLQRARVYAPGLDDDALLEAVLHGFFRHEAEKRAVVGELHRAELVLLPRRRGR